MHKEPNEAWQFLENLTEKNLQWETTREPKRSTPLRGGMHQMSTSLVAEAKITTLTRRIEALKLQGHVQVSQVLAPICNGCDAPGRVRRMSFSNEPN